MINKNIIKITFKIMDNQNENQNLEELSNLSGESSLRQARYTVPILKFNGSKGDFTLLTQDKEGNFVPSEPTSETEGVILKVRRIYTGYQETPSGSLRWYTNEHNSNKDKLILFERPEKGKSRLVAEGTLEEIRTKYPKIRLQQNLYFLLDNEKIVKLGVRGKSLGAFWQYIKEDFKEGEHIFQFLTKITCHQEENKGGISFYVLDFLKAEKNDIDIVGPKIREVASGLEKQDKSFSNSQVGDSKDEKKDEEKKEETEEGKKDIKVEDIPY